MKAFEKVAVVFGAIGILADCFDVLGARLLLIVSWLMLSGLYLIFGASLLRGRSLPFQKKNAEKAPLYSRLLAVISSAVLVLLVSSVMSLWQLMEHGFLLFFFSLIGVVLISIQSFSYWKKKENPVHLAMLARMIPFFAAALLLFFLPTESKLWLKTRDPILRSLALRAIEWPDNAQAQADLLYYQETGKLPEEIEAH